MTNFEELKNAKTKDDFAEILFKYALQIFARHGHINSIEWLDEESMGMKQAMLMSLLAGIKESEDDE